MKAEIRKSAIHDVGVRLDDILEASRSEVWKADGRVSAFIEASRVPVALAAAVRKEVEDGKLDLSVADVVNAWLVKASTAMENLSKSAAMEKVAAAGKIAGLRAAVDVTKGMHDVEEARLRAVADLSAGVVNETERKPSIKLRRLAGEQQTEEVNTEDRKAKRRAKNT